MSAMKKLPDAEFDIMKVIWAHDEPLTTSVIMQEIGNQRKWKPQTVNTLSLRLVERGFIRTEKKNGKELYYYPLITKEAYLKFETGDFIERFHSNSFLSLVATLYEGNKLQDSDFDQLEQWLKEKRD